MINPYNPLPADGIAARVAGYQRRKMFRHFVSATAASARDTILDVGVTADRRYGSSNYLEAWWPHKSRITATGIEDARFLQQQYPGITFLYADGRALPFEDRTFDIVHSSAVLEHVGSFGHQADMIRECARVARKAFFLTTPNRWFPIEFHTALPLVHWLPKPWGRRLMRRLGHDFLCREENLNLMSAAELERIGTGIVAFDLRVESVALLGWPSNLLLIGRRNPPACDRCSGE